MSKPEECENLAARSLFSVVV